MTYDISFMLVPCSGRCSCGGSVLVDSHDFHHPPGEALVKLLEIWQGECLMVWRNADEMLTLETVKMNYEVWFLAKVHLQHLLY